MEKEDKILSKGSFRTKLWIQSDNQDVELEPTNNGRKQKVIGLQWNTRFDIFLLIPRLVFDCRTKKEENWVLSSLNDFKTNSLKIITRGQALGQINSSPDLCQNRSTFRIKTKIFSQDTRLLSMK